MKLSVKLKMMFAFGFIGLILLFVGFLGYDSLKKLDQSYSIIVSDNFAKMKLVGLIQGYAKESSISILTLSSHVKNKERANELESDYKSWLMRFNEIKQQYDLMAKSAAESEIAKNFDNKWKAYNDFSMKAFALANKDHIDDEAAKQIVTIINDDVDSARLELNEALMRLSNFQNESADRLASEAQITSKSLSRVSISSVIAGFIFSILLGMFFSYWLNNVFSKIAKRLGTRSEELKSSAENLRQDGALLASQIAAQASSVQETLSATEEIASTVRQTTQRTETSLTKSSECQNAIIDGVNSMESLSQSIALLVARFEQITKKVNSGYEKVESVATLIANIKEKTSIVNEIVFQTKLLSFNASVEAARAGEHGRGFSVVAEEVGSLAQLSGKAAAEINEMIDSSLLTVKKIVNEMQAEIATELEAGQAQVHKGQTETVLCRENFKRIETEMALIQLQSQEISTASQEQALGVDEINKSILHIDSASQNNTLTAQRMLELSGKFEQMSEEISRIAEVMKHTLAGTVGPRDQGDLHSEKNQNQVDTELLLSA